MQGLKPLCLLLLAASACSEAVPTSPDEHAAHARGAGAEAPALAGLGTPVAVFNVQLRAEEEPNGASTSDSKGHAQIKVLQDGTMEFVLNLNNKDAETFTRAHLHKGAAGVNGPIHWDFLEAGNPVASIGGHPVKLRVLGRARAVAVLSDLLANPDLYYVNVHSTVFPGGAVRGQLPPPPFPAPLPTEFEGPITGVTQAEVEAACRATPLLDPVNQYYVIQQLERLVTSRTFANPWPGRANGDVHAQETTTSGKLRFSCTQKHRDGTAGAPFVVELGQEEGPTITPDVKVCETDGAGGSQATAINTGQLVCPHDFGNIFPAIADYFNPGPFPTVEVVEGPVCTIFRPATLGENNRRHPILLWANGITLGPNFYRQLLTHFATHGFVVAAADTSRVGTAGNGENLAGCLAYLETQNGVSGGAYENKLNLYRVGAAGHSAGGGGVIMMGKDPRITTTAPIQPWVGPQHGYVAGASALQNGPMFLTSGELDTEIPPAHPLGVFNGANQPTIWAERLGSGHNDPLFSAPLYRRPLTAWFRYQLMLDQSAKPWFYGASCVLCTSPVWVVQQKNGI